MLNKAGFALLYLIRFSLPVRMMLENFLRIFVTLIIETLFFSKTFKRELKHDYIAFYTLSWTAFLILTILLLSLIIASFFKDTKKESFLCCLWEGLNKK